MTSNIYKMLLTIRVRTRSAIIERIQAGSRAHFTNIQEYEKKQSNNQGVNRTWPWHETWTNDQHRLTMFESKIQRMILAMYVNTVNNNFNHTRCLTAVSYTHLDVYKRQATQILVDFQMSRTASSVGHTRVLIQMVHDHSSDVEKIRPSVKIAAVSYTHLDVYKRQIRNLVLLIRMIKTISSQYEPVY